MAKLQTQAAIKFKRVSLFSYNFLCRKRFLTEFKLASSDQRASTLTVTPLREHSPLGKVSLYGWSLVLQVCTELLHYILIATYFLLLKSNLVRLETSCTVILPPTVSVLWTLFLTFRYLFQAVPKCQAKQFTPPICKFNLYKSRILAHSSFSFTNFFLLKFLLFSIFCFKIHMTNLTDK